MARTWKVRPSELYHITDPLTAFYFDRAIATFGRDVEAAMNEAAEGAKNNKEATRRRNMAFARFMKDEEGKVLRGTFKDPSAAAR